jgi:hypothetical protein
MPESDRQAKSPRVLVPSRDAGFTLAGYRQMLEAALDRGYSFRAFDDPDRARVEPVCLLRHDIDADLGAAAVIAEVEAELGVRSTFFVMLRSPVYNLVGRANDRLVRRILDYGHWLGLHYDQGFQPDGQRTVHDWVELEVDVLSRMFGVDVGAVSFHQPGPAVLQNEVKLDGLVNTYDQEDLAGFAYVSDSNMIWRDRPAVELFRSGAHPRLHLLVHPLWWVADEPGTTTLQAFDRALLANWGRSQEQMLDTERAYGPPRSFTIDYP